MFEEICAHIKESSNNGIIIPMITVFPERKPSGKDPVRVWNPQLIAYAGYASENSKNVVGDRGNLQFTQVFQMNIKTLLNSKCISWYTQIHFQFCESLGWKGNGGQFDVLPLVLSGLDGKPKWFEIPDEIIMRVKINHPTIPEIGKMGLQWYGLPAVSGMLMEVGGIQFPACPFSGWYAVTEITTRDLLDPHRYNLLHVRTYLVNNTLA